jgi:DNA recombination protein RmuC
MLECYVSQLLWIFIIALLAFAVGGFVFYGLAKRQQLALANAERLLRQQQLVEVKARSDEFEELLDELRKKHSLAEAKLSELNTRLELERSNHAEKLLGIQNAEARLLETFQNTASKILDERAEKFNEQSQKQVSGLLEPLKEQLKYFRETVDNTNKEIYSLKQLNQQITQDAANLTRALKGDSRTQGAWGELVLERILEASGLSIGRDFEVQTSLKDEDGGRPRPDVIIRLPDNKDLVLDAKVSLTAYERFTNAENDEARQLALNEHLLSLKNHINGLSKRDYASLPGLRTLDFVLLFIPIEAAFIDAVRADDQLYRYALEKNIVIVGPSTLLATLRTVAHLWKLEDRSRNADKIAKEAGGLYDQFVMLEQEFGNVGEQLEKALRSHESAVKRIGSGKGNLLGRVEKLRKLGANTKKQLPVDKLLDSEDDSDAEA